MTRLALMGAAAAAMVVLSGCFPFDPGPGFPPGGSVDAGPPIVIPTDPLLATGTLDTARAVKGVFGWDAGGALTVTAADGTVFTLTVPGTSLTEATEITMTPYATLDTGLGETSHGVKLEPAGLQATTTFMELSITPPAAVTWPVGEQVPFTLQGDRDVVSLATQDARTAAVKLLIGHFSSYGLALAKKGYDATLAGVRHRLGSDAEAQLETEVSQYLAQERQEQLLGRSGDPAFADRVLDFLRRYLEQIVKPRIAAAKASCANARLATQAMLGFERQRQLLGFPGATDFKLDMLQLFDLNEVCMKEEYELCRDNHIITRILPRYLGVLRQEQLLGLAEQGFIRPSRLKAEGYLRMCLQFSLALTSSVTYTEGTGASTFTMRESMDLPPMATAGYVFSTDGNPSGLPHVDALGGFINGPPAEFSVSGYEAQYQNLCYSVTSLTPRGGQLGIASLAFRPKTAPDGSPGDPATRAQVGDFFITPNVLPNGSKHVVSQRSTDSNGVCTGTATSVTREDSWTTRGYLPWMGSWNATSLSGWTIVGGQIIATKSVHWTGQGTDFRGDFTLRHIPEVE